MDCAVRNLDLDRRQINEQIFSLDLQLGRHLAATGEHFDGLPFFKECEQARNCAGRTYELQKKISLLIGGLFYRACSLHIKNCRAISFALDSMSFRNSHPANESIFEGFFIKKISVENYEYSESFLLRFELCGAVADLFKKYEISQYWELVCENPNGETYVRIASQEDLSKHINPNDANISQYSMISSSQEKPSAEKIEKNLNALLGELSQELFFLQISNPI